MLIGNISEFSLPELFKMIGEGDKTGLLCLTPDSKVVDISNRKETENYYIWFKKGEIIATANRLDGKGLVTLMSRRSWIDKEELFFQLTNSKSVKKPFGLLLKSQNLIKDDELEILFRMQVSRQVMPLFEIKKATFKFYENVSAPFSELTGLSINTQDLVLKSLRVLRDWSLLKDKLPARDSILGNIPQNQSPLNLDEWEKQLLQLCCQNITLHQIAQKLKLHITQVQQVAFRLISIGLVEEIPVVVTSNKIVEFPLQSDKNNAQATENTLVSSTYMNKLLSFLGSRESSAVAA